jgi:hypothetical protein
MPNAQIAVPMHWLQALPFAPQRKVSVPGRQVPSVSQQPLHDA